MQIALPLGSVPARPLYCLCGGGEKACCVLRWKMAKLDVQSCQGKWQVKRTSEGRKEGTKSGYIPWISFGNISQTVKS